MGVIKSAGIAIIFKNKLLLGHPTGQGDDMWGIPKGKIEKGEDYIDAAIRETYEEVGIKVEREQIDNLEWKTIIYRRSRNNQIYKKVFYCVLEIDSLDDIGLESLEVPKSNLDIREIDKCKFMDKEEATNNIFWRFVEMIDLI